MLELFAILIVALLLSPFVIAFGSAMAGAFLAVLALLAIVFRYVFGPR